MALSKIQIYRNQQKKDDVMFYPSTIYRTDESLQKHSKVEKTIAKMRLNICLSEMQSRKHKVEGTINRDMEKTELV